MNNSISSDVNNFYKILNFNKQSINTINNLINNVNKNNYNINLDYINKFIFNLNIKLKYYNYEKLKSIKSKKYKKIHKHIKYLTNKTIKLLFKTYNIKINNKKSILWNNKNKKKNIMV